MNISRLTAAIIQTRDDIVCTSGGPCGPSGLYVGWITLGPDDRCRPLLSTEPIYRSDDEASAAMRATVAEIRSQEPAL